MVSIKEDLDTILSKGAIPLKSEKAVVRLCVLIVPRNPASFLGLFEGWSKKEIERLRTELFLQ